MKTNTCHLGWLLAVALCATSVAQADLWQNIYRGLDLLVTPTGAPLVDAGDGTRINGSRSGRLRIMPNGVFGRGYRLELDRAFGPDSRGRDETFRFGPLGELTLQGSVQATAGYTQVRDFRSGTLDLTVNALNYKLRTTTGGQDVELTGTLNVFNELELNEAGFYTLNLNVNHANSQLRLDGVLVRDRQDTNFDIGPIVIEGNIFFDAAVALLTALGVDTSGLEGIFPKSPIDRINDAIEQSLQETRAVAGTSVEANPQALLLQAILQPDDQTSAALVDAWLTSSVQTGDSGTQSGRLTIPEPGTLVLLAVSGTLIWCWRRR